MQRPRPPGPRPQYNPGLQQVDLPLCCKHSKSLSRDCGNFKLAEKLVFVNRRRAVASISFINQYHLLECIFEDVFALQVPMCFTDAANIMPPRGPAMWGPPQPAPPMHGGEYPAFMHHGNFGQGPWGPYGPGGHPGDMQPRY